MLRVEKRPRTLTAKPVIVLTLALALVVAVVCYLLPAKMSYVRAPDFSLIDQNGRPFTLSSQQGHPLVLFFGYTHCPDACPLTLAHLAHGLRATQRDGDVRVVFISVDPMRDTSAALKRYLALFDPHFIGLVTTRTNLYPLERAYHTWSQTLPSNHNSHGDYTVVHGSTTYFIDRNGAIRGFGNWNDPLEKVERDIKNYLS